jgi:hypothetical protein
VLKRSLIGAGKAPKLEQWLEVGAVREEREAQHRCHPAAASTRPPAAPNVANAAMVPMCRTPASVAVAEILRMFPRILMFRIAIKYGVCTMHYTAHSAATSELCCTVLHRPAKIAANISANLRHIVIFLPALHVRIHNSSRHHFG